MNYPTRSLLLALPACLFVVASAQAQFNAVITIPGDRIFRDSLDSLGGQISRGIQVNVNDGGSVGTDFSASSGSELNLNGGTVGESFRANSGSVVNIRGGSVDFDFRATPGSEVNISGGNVSFGFEALPGSDVELIGGEFTLNDAVFNGPTLTLGADDVFTGTLADGSTFVFNVRSSDILSGVTLTPVALPALNTAPQIVTSNITGGPSGLRAGQDLTLQNGGVLGDNFAVVDATLNIEGGSVGSGLETARSTVNISGGNVGDDFFANAGSQVNISGGNVGIFFVARSGSEVNISGGNLDGPFRASSGSEVNISGGDLGRGFGANDGSEVNFLGTSFSLDGEILDALAFNEPFTITDRDVTLSGTLADGSLFSIDLTQNGPFSFSGDFVNSDATLTVTLIPEPTSLALLGLSGLAMLRRRRSA